MLYRLWALLSVGLRVAAQVAPPVSEPCLTHWPLRGKLLVLRGHPLHFWVAVCILASLTRGGTWTRHLSEPCTFGQTQSGPAHLAFSGAGCVFWVLLQLLSLFVCSPPPPTPKFTVLMYHLPSDQTLLLLIETPCVGRLQRVLLCPQERVRTPLRCLSHLRAHGGRTASQLGRQLVQTDLSSLAWEGFELRLPPGGQCLNQPGDSTAPEQRPIRPCEVSPSVAVVMHLLRPHRSSIYRELAQCARCWGRKAGRANTDSHLCSPNVLGSSPSSATY